MATPAHIFPCPFCGRRMGVRTEMLGRPVRCPRCSQIVLAPAPVPEPGHPDSAAAKPFSHTAPTPPSTPAPVPPVEPAASPNPQTAPEDGSKITFDKKKEAADSILSDKHDSDDEVFSSQSPSKIPVPVLPAFDPDPPLPLPAADASASKIPTLELRTPVEIIPAPVSASALLPPPPSPPPPPPPTPLELSTTSSPATTTLANPFAFETSKPAPLAESNAAPVHVPMETLVPAESHSSTQRSSPVSADRQRAPRWILYVLVPYAALMTVLAIYGLFFRTAASPERGHPLSTIPDTFGEFDPATRKKVSQLKLDFDAPLPAVQVAALGQSLRIGQLEIQPIAVEKRPLKIVKEAQGETQRRTSRFDALVLKLSVKNNSLDRPIFPLDPAFTRSAKMDDRPAMRLVIGRQTLYGGAISWPFGERVKREYEEAQTQDDQPLKPGESREYVVFTNEDSSLAQVIKKAGEPLLWRVQVRRGVVEHGGRDVPVSAIIGIEFNASEIRNLD